MKIDDDLRVKWLIVLIIAIIFCLFCGIKEKKTEKQSFDRVVAIQSPYFMPAQIYADNMEVDNMESIVNKIIFCESGWNSNAKNPESSAYGLGQFTNGTWQYVQKKWGITLDRESYEDQLYATKRLLDEEGTSHWRASQNCWNK